MWNFSSKRDFFKRIAGSHLEFVYQARQTLYSQRMPPLRIDIIFHLMITSMMGKYSLFFIPGITINPLSGRKWNCDFLKSPFRISCTTNTRKTENHLKRKFPERSKNNQRKRKRRNPYDKKKKNKNFHLWDAGKLYRFHYSGQRLRNHQFIHLLVFCVKFNREKKENKKKITKNEEE